MPHARGKLFGVAATRHRLELAGKVPAIRVCSRVGSHQRGQYLRRSGRSGGLQTPVRDWRQNFSQPKEDRQLRRADESSGLPTGRRCLFQNPFDLFADFMRGFKGGIIDMFRHKDKPWEAKARACPASQKRAGVNRAQGPPPVSHAHGMPLTDRPSMSSRRRVVSQVRHAALRRSTVPVQSVPCPHRRGIR